MRAAEILFFLILFGVVFWALYGAYKERKSKEQPKVTPLSSNDTIQSLSVDNLIEQLKIKIAAEESKARAGVLSSESLLNNYKDQLKAARNIMNKIEDILLSSEWNQATQSDLEKKVQGWVDETPLQKTTV